MFPLRCRQPNSVPIPVQRMPRRTPMSELQGRKIVRQSNPSKKDNMSAGITRGRMLNLSIRKALSNALRVLE